MFGQTANTSFGGFNTGTQNSPFGQSAFGKPITTTSFGTGATPVFGSNNSLFNTKPAGTTSGGLFGSSAGTSAFGQPTTTQSTFGGFGGTTTFGAQQPANTNLFGASSAAPAFGQVTKPAGFGFGTSSNTSLFGQPQQAQQATGFNQPNTSASTGLFGSSSGFGASNTAVGMTGTVIPFKPINEADTIVKNGLTQNIVTRNHCITCMKEYESKSFEELRYEDYAVGRKGPQNQTTGLFGAPAQPSLFGVSTAGTSTATPSFGSTSGGFGTTNQTAGTGLFNKPITGFGAPTTTTSAFGFNSTPSNLFGVNSQPKPFGAAAPAPLFSNTNTATATGTGFGTTQNTGFGNFGTAQQNRPNQSIDLFYQNKPAFALPTSSTTTGFGGFGQPSTANTGTSLFGTKPLGTTGFGTSTFGTTTPSFGTNLGFGTTQNTNTSLFNTSFKPTGQTTGFSFGNTGLGTNTGLNLSGGTSLFNQQKPGGLFGSSTGAFNTTGFGTSTGFGTTTTMPSLGMNMLGGVGINQTQQNASSVPIHQQILAMVSAPFGNSPLLKNLLPASGKTEELMNPANLKNRIISPQYKVSTTSPKIKPKVATSSNFSKKSLFEGLEEDDPSLIEAFLPRPNAKRLVLRPKHVNISQTVENIDYSLNNSSSLDNTRLSSKDSEINNKENQESQSPTDSRSSVSWLKSSIPLKRTPEETFDSQQSPFRGSDIPPEGIDNTIAELRPNISNPNQFSVSSNISADINSSDSTERDSDSPQEFEEIPHASQQLESTIANLAKVKLQRVGYYTIPSIDKLDDYVSGESCIVPNFTVGRKGYGNVYFPDSFDIYGLNLDEIVYFRHKEVIIYPDDDKKPPIGQGLNRRAQITLDRVWPQEKTRREAITDPNRLQEMNYEAKLRRVSAKHDTRFLEYRPETGSWVFKVDHF